MVTKFKIGDYARFKSPNEWTANEGFDHENGNLVINVFFSEIDNVEVITLEGIHRSPNRVASYFELVSRNGPW